MLHSHLLFVITLSSQLESLYASNSPAPVYGNGPKQKQILPNIPEELLITTTVYGFLDFVTTIGNTVMVFTPMTEPAQPVIKGIASTAIHPSPSVSQTTSTVIQEPIVTKNKGKQRIIVTVSTSSDNKKEPPKPVTEQPATVVDVVTSPALEGSEGDISNQVANVVDEDPEPNFALQSTQPLFVAPASYKTLPVSKKNHFSVQVQTQVKIEASKTRPPQSFPTGLVSRIGATDINNGLTTVHETSVIGTFINKKYAQVLQSTSRIYGDEILATTPADNIYSILENQASVVDNEFEEEIEPSASASEEKTVYVLPDEEYADARSSLIIAASKRVADGKLSTRTTLRRNPDFLNKLRSSRTTEQPDDRNEEATTSTTTPTTTTKRSTGYNSRPSRPLPGRSGGSSRYGSSGRRYQQDSQISSSLSAQTSERPSTEATTSGSRRSSGAYSSRGRGYQRGGSNSYESTSPASYPVSPRRGFTPRQKYSQSEAVIQPTSSSSIYRFKLSRPTGRWRYKASPKPQVSILRTNPTPGNIEEPTTESEFPSIFEINNAEGPAGEALLSGFEGEQQLLDLQDISQEPTPPTLETLRVTTTVIDEAPDAIIEIATIRSPYVFHAGNVKNTRFITITQTLTQLPSESTLLVDPSLPENILASSSPIEQILEGSHDVALLPPIFLVGDMSTPPLETVTQTFSTTEMALKTSLLPVVKDGSTWTKALTQTYMITRYVTALKTLPPLELYQFIPSKTLNEFNSRLQEAGSEKQESLLPSEFEDDDNNNDPDTPPNQRKVRPPPGLFLSLEEANLSQVGAKFDPGKMEKNGFLLPSLGFQPKKEEVTTVPTPYGDHNKALLQYFNPFAQFAQQPIISTSTRQVLLTKPVYETFLLPLVAGAGSTTFTAVTRQAGVTTLTETEFIPQTIAPVVSNPYQQYTVTSIPVETVITVTQTHSKVLRLSFGARATQTTIYSTQIVPTHTTVYVTTSVPVTPSAYSPFYPPFPFLG